MKSFVRSKHNTFKLYCKKKPRAECLGLISYFIVLSYSRMYNRALTDCKFTTNKLNIKFNFRGYNSIY